jgi:ParB-like nuclease domain
MKRPRSRTNEQCLKSPTAEATKGRSRSTTADRRRQTAAQSAVTDIAQPLAIESMAVARLRPYSGNARTHSKKQIRQIADSIRRFGFTNPVLIGKDGEIIAGHGRVEAAKLIGMESVPTVRLAHLDAAQRRAYVLADNKLALNAAGTRRCWRSSCRASWHSTSISRSSVSRPPRSTSCDVFDLLLGTERADLIFTDPPYNVPIDGHAVGLGRIRRREFAMGGEMSVTAFTRFLQRTLGHAAALARNGAWLCLLPICLTHSKL